VIPVMPQPITDTGHETAVAYAHLTFKNESLHSAVVYMSNWENLPSMDLDRAMKHELGHCLGLDHDENTFSVMYGELSRRVYCVSPMDKEFLVKVYG
jgi:predicted Zn-dependent protease